MWPWLTGLNQCFPLEPRSAVSSLWSITWPVIKIYGEPITLPALLNLLFTIVSRVQAGAEEVEEQKPPEERPDLPLCEIFPLLFICVTASIFCRTFLIVLEKHLELNLPANFALQIYLPFHVWRVILQCQGWKWADLIVSIWMCQRY